jgi:hypothetical protein
MALSILLAALGTFLSIASRARGSIRAAITRDIVVGIETKDGVSHRFIFRNRTMTSASGSAPPADCVLRFATSSQALATLLSRHTVTRLYEALLDGSVTIEGNPFRVLWFYDLTQWVVPLAARPSWTTPPGAYKVPSTTVPWAARISREPVATELDPTWQDAARQRAKLKMMRVVAGEPTLEF